MAAGALTASQNMYNEFAKVLSLAQQNNERPEVHVAQEKGLASQFAYICSSLHQLCSDGRAGTDDLDPSFLKIESNTWILVMHLYKERLSNIPPPQSVRQILASNPYVASSHLKLAIVANNRAVRELRAIEQWVQAIFVLPAGHSLPPSTNEYQTFTRMELAQKRRTRTAANGLVDALDPDAVNRPVKGSRDPGALNPEDANYEEKLARSIFYCIRGGQLHDAATLARQSARPWWAATLLGSEEISLDLVTSVSSGRHDGEMWVGNRRRRLWKECCMRAAASSLMSPLERAIYAAIAPTSTTLPALLPFCKTFEDHIWARTIGLVQDKVETELSKVENQSYWESQGSARGAFEPRAVPDEEVDMTLEFTHNDAFEDAEWGRIAKEQLAEIGRIAVSEGAHASHPLHRAQMHIIMSTESTLVEAMKVSALNNAPPDHLRFYTHLALFFALTDIPVSHDSVAVIVEAYIEVLQHLNMREHVALYTSFLGHSAVKRYSEFLASLPLDMQHHELKQALLRAEKYHLDIKRVAEEAARTVSQAALAQLPYDRCLPEVAEADQKALDELDRQLIRSVWWLSYHQSTHLSILRHSNAIIRSFLARGRITAAATVHNALPPNLLNPPPASADKINLDQQEAEHGEFKRLFNVWDACSNVETMAEDEGRGGFDFTLGLSDSSSTVNAFRGGWKRQFKTRVDEVRGAVVDLLTSGWLLLAIDPEDHSQRAQELRKIRKIFIPELVMRLTRVLQKARKHYPESVAHAMELANILADGKHELYWCFVTHEGNRMGRYLTVLQELLLDALQMGGSDPFAPLTQVR